MWSQGLSVTADGDGVVRLAGEVAVRLLADRAGSHTACRQRWIGGVSFLAITAAVDVATMLTAGGEAIADIDTLRHHAGCWGRSPRCRRCDEHG